MLTPPQPTPHTTTRFARFARPAGHPFDVGGLYWCAVLAIGQATSFVAAYLYTRDGEKMGIVVAPRDIWALMGVLEACFVVFFGAFMAMIKQKYRLTFLSTVTGKQFSVDKFKEAKCDEARIEVFSKHPSYYESNRKAVKLWVLENYFDWIDERPEWFTERVKALIPIDMLPNYDDEDSNVTTEGTHTNTTRRRTSGHQLQKTRISK